MTAAALFLVGFLLIFVPVCQADSVSATRRMWARSWPGRAAFVAGLILCGLAVAL